LAAVVAGLAEKLEASTASQAEALANVTAALAATRTDQSAAIADVTQALDRLVAVPQSSACGTVDDPFQCAALFALLRATTWKTDVRTPSYSSYCQWKGVTCGGDSGSDVVALDLSGLGYAGHLPAELGNLNALQRLNVRGNVLGRALPSQIGLLTSLTSLDLSGNAFVGTLPASFNALTSLVYLNVSANANLAGTVPLALQSLSQIYLSGTAMVQLSPPPPSPSPPPPPVPPSPFFSESVVVDALAHCGGGPGDPALSVFLPHPGTYSLQLTGGEMFWSGPAYGQTQCYDCDPATAASMIWIPQAGPLNVFGQDGGYLGCLGKSCGACFGGNPCSYPGPERSWLNAAYPGTQSAFFSNCNPELATDCRGMPLYLDVTSSTTIQLQVYDAPFPGVGSGWCWDNTGSVTVLVTAAATRPPSPSPFTPPPKPPPLPPSPPPRPLGYVATIAGNGNYGFLDGPSMSSSFNAPQGVAVDLTGSIYVGDVNNKAVRKIVDGIVTTLAGSGDGHCASFADGIGTHSSFAYPSGLALDSLGNLYVADNRAIRRISVDGDVTTVAGLSTDCCHGVCPSSDFAYADGTGTAVRFNGVVALSFDPAFNFLFSLECHNNVIRRVNVTSGEVTTVVGSGASGYQDGSASAASFNFAWGLATDPSGSMYVADRGNNRIRKVSLDGTVSTFAGSGVAGSLDGSGTFSSFAEPISVAVDSASNVYVSEFQGNRVRMITPEGVVSTIAGTGLPQSTDGSGTEASFNHPQGVAVAGSQLYVVDSFGNRLRIVSLPPLPPGPASRRAV